MSSIAHEESRSISENVTWGKRKAFQDGKVALPYKCFLGYKKGENGLPEIEPEGAKIVRRIYKMFIEGKSQSTIANILTKEGVPTPGGKTKWQYNVVDSILRNEKYKGSALLQKKYTVDFLTKKLKKNNGEVAQYYVEDSHPAIINPDEWELVQAELELNNKLEVMEITYYVVELYVLIVVLYTDLRYGIQMISICMSYGNVITNLTELNALLLLSMKKQLKLPI